jgi:hypothetical protein
MEVHIRKYGVKMNSPDPTRANLFIEIQPFNSIPTVISTLQNLDTLWEYRVPFMDTWYRYQQCMYCLQRAKYELEKFKEGVWYWNRRWCMRHYLIEHLGDILGYKAVIESNRPVDFYISRTQIKLVTGSNNYKYHIEISRQYAVMAVDYKGSRYVFKYNNHANALPFASSYVALLHEVKRIVRHFVDFLDSVDSVRREKFNCSALANIYVNSELFLPACQEEVKNCPKCRIILR